MKHPKQVKVELFTQQNISNSNGSTAIGLCQGVLRLNPNDSGEFWTFPVVT